MRALREEHLPAPSAEADLLDALALRFQAVPLRIVDDASPFRDLAVIGLGETRPPRCRRWSATARSQPPRRPRRCPARDRPPPRPAPSRSTHRRGLRPRRRRSPRAYGETPQDSRRWCARRRPTGSARAPALRESRPCGQTRPSWRRATPGPTWPPRPRIAADTQAQAQRRLHAHTDRHTAVAAASAPARAQQAAERAGPDRRAAGHARRYGRPHDSSRSSRCRFREDVSHRRRARGRNTQPGRPPGGTPSPHYLFGSPARGRPAFGVGMTFSPCRSHVLGGVVSPAPEALPDR
jgi:hypothetical protein